MGKSKKTISVEEPIVQQEQIVQEEPIVQPEPIVEQEYIQPEPTIFDKYRHYIKQANSNCIQGIKYSEIMEIHRYVEKVLNKQLGLDTSCGVCVIKRIKQFATLENKL